MSSVIYQKLFPKAAPQKYSLKLLPKAGPQSCFAKMLLKVAPQSAPQNYREKI